MYSVDYLHLLELHAELTYGGSGRMSGQEARPVLPHLYDSKLVATYLLEGFSFCWSKTCRLQVSLGIVDINRLPGTVQIPRQDDRPVFPEAI